MVTARSIFLLQPSVSRTTPRPPDPSDESLGYFQSSANADSAAAICASEASVKHESLSRPMGNYRWRVSDSPGTTHLFRRVQLVWKIAWRHSLRERASSGLHSNRVDAHCLAGVKFDLLFNPQILLSRIGIPACPFMIETSPC